MKFSTLIAALLPAATLLSLGTPSVMACGNAENACELSDGSYHMLLPDIADPIGLVMHLHGGGGTGRSMLGSGLAAEALARGYVFVAPSGEHPENRWSRDWSVPADGMSFDRDDLIFLQDVVADARSRSGLPHEPLLLAGFSRGGSMAWTVACLDPDFAAAFAPMAGAFWDSLPAECAGPVRLFHTHGWTDRVVPLEGRSFGEVVQGDVWASLKILRETNGCANRQPESSEFKGDHWYRYWTDCAEGRIDLLLHQGGHGAPEGWPSITMDWFEEGLE